MKLAMNVAYMGEKYIQHFSWKTWNHLGDLGV